MASLFEEYQFDVVDSCPIIMIDCSGSTRSKMADGQSILQTLGNKAIQTLEGKQVNELYLIFWNYLAVNKGKMTINQLQHVIQKQISTNRTKLTPAFDMISDKMLDRPCVDIYIMTDGHIDDSVQFSNRITKLINKYPNINVHIITVDKGETDYSKTNYDTGSAIYQVIHNMKLTNYFRSYMSYNDRFVDKPFVNFSNPNLKEGYMPFREKCFPLTKLREFIVHVANLVTQDDVDRLLYDLSTTLYCIVKDKPARIRNDIVDIFCRLFVGVKGYGEVYTVLSSQMVEMAQGQAATFQDYRNRRNKLFTRVENSLLSDVKRNVTMVNGTKYVSMPVLTTRGELVIVVCSGNDMVETVCLGNKKYEYAGIRIGDSVVPLFPYKVAFNDFVGQCIRQWIRAVCSTVFERVANDDL